ncbi:MAG: hypothetical protein H6622_13500 [Halobacteriovoraceae bacterium]|nr:hypothetical protein [Halobacteriovoraceae bacterium]
MSDPISTTSGIVTILQSGFQFLEYVKSLAGSDVISAVYRWDGTLVEGSSKIPLRIQFDESKTTWWYWVERLEDYTFVRFPVVSSCLQEIPGQRGDEQTTNADYWRWVPVNMPGTIVGGNSNFKNIMVDFMIIGYRKKALIKQFTS